MSGSNHLPFEKRTLCRIWQLKPQVDPAMRFIGYEDLMQRFGSPDIDNYLPVFDGDLSTTNLEQIYTICRNDSPSGYRGHKMSISDVVELYNFSGSEFFYCDRVGFVQIDL